MSRTIAFPRPYSKETQTVTVSGTTASYVDFDLRQGYAGFYSLIMIPSANTGNGLDNMNVFISTLEEDASNELAMLDGNSTSGLTLATALDMSTDDAIHGYSLNEFYSSYGTNLEFLHGAGLRVEFTNVSGGAGDTGTITVSLGRR